MILLPTYTSELNQRLWLIFHEFTYTLLVINNGSNPQLSKGSLFIEDLSWAITNNKIKRTPHE